MADGILCFHCGWQETEHEHTDFAEKELLKKIFPGRKKSLDNCPGFKPEDPKLAKELANKAEEEALEQEMRRVKNLAYGMWGR